MAEQSTTSPMSEKERILRDAGLRRDPYDTATPWVVGSQILIGVGAFLVSVPLGIEAGFEVWRTTDGDSRDFSAAVGGGFVGPWVSSVAVVWFVGWMADKKGSVLGSAALGLLGLLPAVASGMLLGDFGTEDEGIVLLFLAPVTTLTFSIAGYHVFAPDPPDVDGPTVVLRPERGGATAVFRWEF